MAIEEFFNRIRAAGEDLATLDVATLTGTIEVPLSGDKIDFEKLVSSIQQSAAAVDGSVQVVALTHIELDKDAVNFVKSGLTEGEGPLIEAHTEMVKAAQEARLAVVNFVLTSLGVGR